MPKSGIVVFPTMTAPASFNRAAGGESKVESGTSALAAHPCRHGVPTACTLSLMVTGSPSNGPSGAPAAQRRVAPSAADAAPSAST